MTSTSDPPKDAPSGSRRLAVWALLGIVVVAAAAPLLAFHVPDVFGQDESYLVLSGSMEPTFPAGAIIYNEQVDPAKLQEGDVITYRTQAGGPATTHRIVEVVQDDGLAFRTQGDANREADPNPVPADQVQSRYSFHVPLYGHLVLFASTPVGFLLFVLVPAGTIMAVHIRAAFEALDDLMEPGDEPFEVVRDGPRTAARSREARSP